MFSSSSERRLRVEAAKTDVSDAHTRSRVAGLTRSLVSDLPANDGSNSHAELPFTKHDDVADSRFESVCQTDPRLSDWRLGVLDLDCMYQILQFFAKHGDTFAVEPENLSEHRPVPGEAAADDEGDNTVGKRLSFRSLEGADDSTVLRDQCLGQGSSVEASCRRLNEGDEQGFTRCALIVQISLQVVGKSVDLQLLSVSVERSVR